MNKSNTILSICFILVFISIPGKTIAQTSFWVNPGNPVLQNGLPGEWDSGIILLANIVVHNDTFYLFYSGSTNISTDPSAIGFATSADGLNFTKSNSNPIFEADGTGFDTWAVIHSVVLVDSSKWMLYYDAHPSVNFGPGQAIGFATSSNPSGFWTRLDDPVLQIGSSGEWDDVWIDVNSVIKVDTGFVMYYSGSDMPFPGGTWQIGMAYSLDGITWIKYDDPTTTTPPYAESDPVLQPSPGSWDSDDVWGSSVLKTGMGFEMFYDGKEAFGYAVSQDGVSWTKDSLSPVLTPAQDPYSNFFELPSAALHCVDDTAYYLMYYDYGTSVGNIGMAKSSSDSICITVNVESISNVPNEYRLNQNYPNPFNPGTKIRYSVPLSSKVVLKVFDILGNEIETLVNDENLIGSYEVNWNAANLPSGVYFYRLKAGEFVETKKMILMR